MSATRLSSIPFCVRSPIQRSTRLVMWHTHVRTLTFYHKSDRQQVVESKRKLCVSRKSESTRRKTSDDATLDSVVAAAVGGGHLWFGPVGRSTSRSSCRCHCARDGLGDGGVVAQAIA